MDNGQEMTFSLVSKSAVFELMVKTQAKSTSFWSINLTFYIRKEKGIQIPLITFQLTIRDDLYVELVKRLLTQTGALAQTHTFVYAL